MKSIVLITGPRDWTDRSIVFATLDRLHAKRGDLTVLHGACCEKNRPTVLRGVDRWAQEWAQEHEQAYIGVPAQWATRGDTAGPIRNTMMLHIIPTGVVAFRYTGRDWTAGTGNMVGQARESGLSVWEVEG